MIWWIAVLLALHAFVVYIALSQVVTTRLRANLEHERWQRRYDTDTLLLDLALVLEDGGIGQELREAVREVMRRRCFTHPTWMTESLTNEARHSPTGIARRTDSTLEHRRSAIWFAILDQFPTEPWLQRTLSNRLVTTWREAEAEARAEAQSSEPTP